MSSIKRDEVLRLLSVQKDLDRIVAKHELDIDKDMTFDLAQQLLSFEKKEEEITE
jgi:hypothetical protein